MFLQVSLLTLLVFQAANSEFLQDEKIDPVDLNYHCEHIQDGKEQKSPILLIHGLTASYFNWDGLQQALALRTGRMVCAIDLRNHGDSPWSNQADIEAMAVDVGHFMIKQNIQKVNLIGHSLGGKAAIHYTLNNPERVDSLVVEDMRPNSVNHPALVNVQVLSKILLNSMKSVPEGSTEDEARTIVVGFLREKLAELGIPETMDDETAKKLQIQCTDGKCEWKMNPYLLQKVIDDPDSIMTESKGLYEGPALFIYGKRSSFNVADDEKNILKLFPNAELFGVEGAGHTIHGKHKEFEDEAIKLYIKVIHKNELHSEEL